MQKISHDSLMSLEQYAEARNNFRAKVMAHKKDRQLAIGPNATLYFEDTLTIQYQIQEMLRIERIFAAEAITEELSAYNPLIPDGSNWKATFMIEFGDEKERREALVKMKGIENTIWLQVDGHDKLYPHANEDLGRTNEHKTSAVHFLRFELDGPSATSLKSGAVLSAGIEHPAYTHVLEVVPDNIRRALIGDLN